MLSTCGQQTSGIDILHETSEILEASYERMFVWVQQQCRGPRSAAVTKGSSTELDTPAGATLKRVLALLKERPVYFNHCVRDIARVRQQALVQRFFEALSQGDASIGTKPIELQACDPVRYVSDMLAWIHVATAAERETVAVLMGSVAASTASPSSEGTEGAGAGDAGLTLVSFEDILDFTLEGLVPPFSNRVKQVLEAQPSIVMVYKVSQVFAFYANTLEDDPPARSVPGMAPSRPCAGTCATAPSRPSWTCGRRRRRGSARTRRRGRLRVGAGGAALRRRGREHPQRGAAHLQ
ncbi:unnamed protein product [Prorocentrum cordatum]|uniref:Conserved Oligomeric Golgi complex subunit 6 C-terminal domain-containing protein n=1 Tax=Prorocentrum cordatum TaxID=2364126 RepID=A0ABN9S1Q8_9DINO|nr:unnamed protein product [Polarella glacialis]